jgi:hypothetical protein
MIWLGTCVTPDYPRTLWTKFVESLAQVTGVEKFFLTVDEERKRTLQNVDPGFICLQDGQFLDWLPTKPGDLVILCDADIVLQRDLTATERQRFEAYDDRTIGMSWNAYPNDNLRQEFDRLRPYCRGVTEINECCLADISCYNGGMIVARPETWRTIQAEYGKVWVYRSEFQNPRCSQWLLNFAIYRLGLKVDVLGYEIHSHGHFISAWTTDHFRDPSGLVYYKGERVLARHKL